MNYGKAYAIFQRTNTMMSSGRSSKEIWDDLIRRHPDLKEKSLESILDEVSQTLKT